MAMQSYARGAYYARGTQARRHQASALALGRISSSVLFVMILAVLGMLYLTQITKTSVYGYQLSELEDKRDELLQQNQTLKVESARLQALERVKSSPVAADLSSETDRNYVTN